MQMKKLLSFLIALSLGGFSAMSQAENLVQVYKQARESNPELRKTVAGCDAAFEKSTKRAAPVTTARSDCGLCLWLWLPRCQ